MTYLQTALLGILFLSSAYLVAQESEEERKIYNTKRIDGPAPIIDGEIDDEAWKSVEWGGEFVGHQPEYKAAPTKPTQFKILYDDKFLYVAVLAHDDHDKIVKRMSRRDGFEGDWVEINIDSYGDKRTAFSFTASVSGVKGDELVSNDGNNWDSTWDPIWYLRTALHEKGWVAEYKIPLSQLRFANRKNHIWGIQLTRRLFREQERSTWQPIDPNAPGWVHLFGELHGISGIKSQNQFEVLPYVVGTTERFPKEAGNPYRETGTSSSTNAGVDAKIGLTSDITLDLSINPDFGQVNADPSQVNLSAFQIFFREQRPFFLEGANVLSFGTSGGRNNLFYSRRIGANPSGNLTDDDIAYVDAPGNSRILGAAKLSGKNAKGFSWALMEALTGRTFADVTDNNGEERREKIEPVTNYLATRVQQDINEGQTVVGAIFTNVNRFNNRVNSLDLLHDNAQSAGVDLSHQMWNRSFGFTVRGGYSRVAGTEDAITRTQQAFERSFQRSDNDYRSVDTTRTELTGSFASMDFGKISGNWQFRVGLNYRSPELELNDIGFLRNTDNINAWYWTRYQINKPVGIFRWQNYSFNQETNFDFGGTRTSLSWNLSSNWQFENFWRFNHGLYYETKSIANSDLRGGPALAYPAGLNYWYWISTNDQNAFRVSFNNWFFWGDENYTKTTGFEMNFVWRPIDALRLTVAPSVSFREDAMQYIFNNNESEGIYTLGRITQQTYRMAIRANYNITPNLTIEYWGQPFISSGSYDEFKRITDATASSYTDRFDIIRSEDAELRDGVFEIDEDGDLVSDFSFTNPDFNVVEFRSNLVVRWEYVPGSELFLAWSSNGSFFNRDREQGFRDLSDQLSQLSGTHTFLIKYTYRFIL